MLLPQIHAVTTTGWNTEQKEGGSEKHQANGSLLVWGTPPLLTFGDKSANYLTDKTYSLHFTETGAALVLFFFLNNCGVHSSEVTVPSLTREETNTSLLKEVLQKVNLGDSFHKQWPIRSSVTFSFNALFIRPIHFSFGSTKTNWIGVRWGLPFFSSPSTTNCRRSCLEHKLIR